MTKNLVFGLALLCLAPSEASAWEMSTPRTRTISDQGDYPYCAFHAMATFLESWGNRGRWRALPELDPGYLALSANLEASNGGFWLNSLLIITAKHGILPKGARPVRGTHWPYKNWQEDQKKLIPPARLRRIVRGRYHHRSAWRAFTGRQYLDRRIDIAFEDFRWVKSTYEEPSWFELWEDLWELAPPKHDPEEEEIKDAYRQGSLKKMKKALNKDAARLGINPEPLNMDHDNLYRGIVHQLNRRRPVLLSIFTGFVDGSFSDENLVQLGDLVPYGESTMGKHAVVAVAHCDRWKSRDFVCRRFAEEMKAEKVRECIAIQNSWGTDSHEDGYVCISKKALEPMLYSAMLTSYDIENR